MNKLKKYISEAEERAKRRKSLWNLILIPIGSATTGLSYFIQFKLIWLIHILVYPAHDGRLSDFWHKGISMFAFIPSFLLAIPILFSSLVLGMLSANLLIWFVRPIRIKFDNEAKGIKGASFLEAMNFLVRAALYVVPICFLLGVMGALTLKSLK